MSVTGLLLVSAETLADSAAVSAAAASTSKTTKYSADVVVTLTERPLKVATEPEKDCEVPICVVSVPGS